MELNEVLSKELQVRPLKPGETAKFQLLNAFKKEKGRDEPSTPDLWSLSKKETIFDPFANGGLGKSVLLQCITSYEPYENSDGRVINKPVLKRPEFIKGVLELTHEENNIYIYVMRSNKRLGNPFRKKNITPRFKLLDKNAELQEQIKDSDLTYLAEKIVRESDWTTLRAIADKLNRSSDSRYHVKAGPDELDKLKLELIKIARFNGKQVILASNDKESKLRVNIHDAELFNVLIYTRDLQSWQLNGKTLETVLQVQPGRDAVAALMDHFRTEEGRKHYTAIVTALQRIFKATAQ
jgi:hypothetical protein